MTKDQPSILSFFKAKPDLPTNASTPPKSGASPKPTTTSPPPAPPPPPASKYSQPPATTSKPPAASPVPETLRNAIIRPISGADITPLRRLNALLLPISYSDSFYNRLTSDTTYSRAITWRDSESQPTAEPKLIGAIVCRLEPATLVPVPTGPALYIQSLALLSPYRNLGYAEAALESVLREVGDSATSVYAHVWTENEDGMRWYDRRGFRRVGGRPVEGYYIKLEPSTAWIVRRNIGGEGENGDGAAAQLRREAVAAHERGDGQSKPTSTATSPPPATSKPLPKTSTPSSTSSPPLNPTSPPSAPPGPPAGAPRPGIPTGQSFQNARPETEWNDLPADMMTTPSSTSASARASRNNSSLNLVAGADVLTPPLSAPGSRSSSTAPKKKRAYPAAAFGGK